MIPTSNGHVNGRHSGQVFSYRTPDDEFNIPIPDDDFDQAPELTQQTQGTERTQRTQQTQQAQRTQRTIIEAVSSGSSVSTLPSVAQAIEGSLPKSTSGWKKAVFRFARALKGIPELAAADGQTLRPIVEKWHARASTLLGGESPPAEQVRADFLRAWPKVKFALGAGPLDTLFKQAESQPVPAVAHQYGQPKFRLLVSLCHKLQLHAGAAAWPLSCREAARLLGVSHQTAADWLFLLVQDGVLKLVTMGTKPSGDASTYRWTGGT